MKPPSSSNFAVSPVQGSSGCDGAFRPIRCRKSPGAWRTIPVLIMVAKPRLAIERAPGSTIIGSVIHFTSAAQALALVVDAG